MSNLNFFGQFIGHMGIPIHSREFANELNKHIDLNLYQILPYHQEDSNCLNPALKEKFNFVSPIQKALSIVDKNTPSLIFWYPHLMMRLSYKLNIGYYIFEYTIIPEEFKNKLNTMDVICTASTWGAYILKKNGIIPRCVVVPGGVDSSVFNSKNRNLDSNVFKFLHIGKAENRKNTLLVIKAFNEAFKGDKNVRLTLSIDNPHIKDFSAEGLLYELFGSDELKYDISNIDIVHFVEDIRDLYNTHHIGVYPSAAEGIGLPIVESMASGMPIITSYNSGIAEYTNDFNCILLKELKTIPVYDPYFFPTPGLFGLWETPTLKELIDKMKICYEHYSEIEPIGYEAEKHMREKYNWEIAAKKFMELL